MKNSECIIIIYSDKGIYQTYEKVKKTWLQITNGYQREVTSDQLLSHILPLLEKENNGIFKVKVVKKNYNP